MARFSNRSRAAARRGAKPHTVWFNLNAGSTATAVAANTAVLMATLNATGLALRPFTILRSRGIIHWVSDQVATGETPVGDFGLIVTKETAATAGVASIPTPGTETDADFFVYQSMLDDFVFSTGAAWQSGAGVQYMFDSKAKRRVDVDDDMCWVVENIHATAGALCFVNGRMLVQLH